MSGRYGSPNAGKGEAKSKTTVATYPYGKEIYEWLRNRLESKNWDRKCKACIGSQARRELVVKVNLVDANKIEDIHVKEEGDKIARREYSMSTGLSRLQRGQDWRAEDFMWSAMQADVMWHGLALRVLRSDHSERNGRLHLK